MAVEDMQTKQGPTAGREAIIFIPAIGERTDQSIDGITRRVTTALNHHLRADRKFGYSLEDLEHQYGLQSQHRANVRTISEKTSGQEVPIIDVYELNYQEDLTAEFDKRSQFSQMWALLLVTSMNLWRLVRALGRRGKTLIEKAQVLIGLAIFLLIIAYVVILLWALIDAGIKGLDKDQQLTVTSEQSAAGKSEGQDRRVAELSPIQSIALFLAAAGIFTPSKFKESIRNAATDYVSSIQYIGLGKHRGSLTNKLVALLEYIIESDKGYSRIHVIAYSFGSILALDTFFPRQNPASHLTSVDTLVTIGCPADLVRIFWPKYYGLSERAYRPGAPHRWINIYSTTDVLSSNFRDDNKKDSANVSIAGAIEGKEEEPKPFNLSYEGGPLGERLTIPNIILLLGLRAHAMYWERDGKAGSDVGCFSILVPYIYQSADWVPSSRK